MEPEKRRRLEAQATRAIRELAKVQRLLRASAGLEPALELKLRLMLDSKESWKERAQRWIQGLRAECEAQRPEILRWRDGSVYCFSCARSDCEHAQPSDLRAIFTGYHPTGRPLWYSFEALCSQLRPPGFDQLYDDPPGVVALIQEGAQLRAKLLPEFAQNSGYRILAQLLIGLLPSEPDRQESERVALSLQVVLTQGLGEPLRLRLNRVGLNSAEIAAAAGAGAPRGRAERLRRTLIQSQKRLDSLKRKMNLTQAHGEELELESAACALLNRLRGDLSRLFQVRVDRSLHARERHEGATRPTGSAREDACAASSEALLWDGQRQTVVVLGPRGRAHIFSQTGRHVTSFRLQPGELQRKRGQERWGPLTSAQMQRFKASLMRNSKSAQIIPP